MINQNKDGNFSMSFDESRYYGLNRDGVFHGNISKSRRRQSAPFKNEHITFNPENTDELELNNRISFNQNESEELIPEAHFSVNGFYFDDKDKPQETH